MENKKLNSNWQDLYSNCVRSNMAVFKMPANSMTSKSKCKLFCDEILCINQSLSKNKMVFIY